MRCLIPIRFCAFFVPTFAVLLLCSVPVGGGACWAGTVGMTTRPALNASSPSGAPSAHHGLVPERGAGNHA